MVYRPLAFLALMVGSGCVGLSPAHADMTSALAAITETADRICNNVPTSGEHQRAQVQGDIKAEVNGLLKKLAELGIAGTGEYTSDEYVGVLQSDLPAVLKDNAACKLRVFMILQEKMLPTTTQPPQAPAPAGWSLSSDQAEALRIRLGPIFPKPPVFIMCRTMGSNCDRFAYIFFDVLQKAGWRVAPPMTSRGGNVIITGEQGIRIISESTSARWLTDALQASDVGGLPAELNRGGDDQHIRINIGDRP